MAEVIWWAIMCNHDVHRHLQSKYCMGTSKTAARFPWNGEPCHRKLKLQRFDIVFFYKAGCSSYLWSSTWDKDSAISAQLEEVCFPKVKACITVLSTDFQHFRIFGPLSGCVQSLLRLKWRGVSSVETVFMELPVSNFSRARTEDCQCGLYRGYTGSV